MLLSRNVVIAGRRTSMRLEPEMWDALEAIASDAGFSINELITLARTQEATNLTSGVRIMLLDYFRYLVHDKIPPHRAPWVGAMLARRGRHGALSRMGMAGAAPRSTSVSVAGR